MRSPKEKTWYKEKNMIRETPEEFQRTLGTNRKIITYGSGSHKVYNPVGKSINSAVTEAWG